MVRITQNSFFGGQLDYEMMGRQDFARYQKGATTLRNFNILKRGGLDKRHGFDRIVDLTDSDAMGLDPSSAVRLIPFSYKKNLGYVLVLSGLKMRILRVSSGNIFELYAVKVAGTEDDAQVYTSDEINEIDYQQCGDVMFIAHPNHPPAKITHSISDTGEHGFHYAVCQFNLQNNGIPAISGATITGNTATSGSPFTEYYKATAVFEDGETLPCSAFSGSGTTYYLPWTQQQKIAVKVKVAKRLNQETGEYVYPDEIRLYRKAFNYFGLIRAAKLSYENMLVQLSQGTTTGYTWIKNSDAQSNPDIFQERDLAEWFGLNKGGISIVQASSGTKNKITINLGEAAKGGICRIQLGVIKWDFLDSAGNVTSVQANVAKAVVSFIPNTMQSSEAFEDGERIVASGAITGVIDITSQQSVQPAEVVRDSGEQYGVFVERVREEASKMSRDIEGQQFVDIPITSTTKTLTLTLDNFNGGSSPDALSLVINNISIVHATQLTADGASITVSSDTLTFSDNYITPDSSITPPELTGESFFVGEKNYPSAVSLTQQRLIWASTIKDPARVWMSEVGDFYTYTQHEIQRPDDAIDFTLPVTKFPKINHIIEMRKLLMFNGACEWMVDSSSSNSGLTIGTIQAFPQSYSGSNERLKPVICNNSVVFCERSGQSVRRFAWDLAYDGFAGKDVSVLSCSIFEDNPIVDWTYQQFPFSTLWCALYDGTMASFEFMEEQDIMAWATHELGHGEGNAGKVVSVATSNALSPNLDEIREDGKSAKYDSANHEEIFAAVRRGYYDVDGEFVPTQLWIERMRIRPRSSNDMFVKDTVYHMLCLDSVRVLNQTNGMQPMDPADQTNAGLVYVPSDTKDGKTITRAEAVAKIASGVEVYEGFKYNADFQSVFPVVSQNTVGAGQMDIKDIGHVALRLMPSVGGTVRATGCNETEPIRYDDDPGELKHPRFNEHDDGIVEIRCLDAANVKPVGINTRDGRFHVEQDLPWPFSILMYELDLELETGGGR